MDFRLLGPLEVWDGARPVRIQGAKERSLLAMLLLHANELVSTDRLIDGLWGDDPPESARGSLQVRVSHLRKALAAGGELLVSTAAGYLLRVGPDELDLHRFEELLAEGERALARHDPAAASENLRQALALRRGPALADFAGESFAQPSAARLDELCVTALEKRIEADLELGRHAELVGDLEELADRHPFRERLHGQLMLALYRSGRQAEALAAYRRARHSLVSELGIEPSPMLKGLEQAILRQDPELDLTPPPTPARSVLVAALEDGALDSLLLLAEPLARRPAHELIVVRPVAGEADLGSVALLLDLRRERLLEEGLLVRAAAFTSSDPGEDVARIATEQDVDLVLLDARPERLDDRELGAVLVQAPCDVAVFVARDEPPAPGPVLVPFTGAEHDWAAVELGAWIAAARRSPLRLAGAAADPSAGSRDASRVIAHASLAVQRTLGVAAEPVLVSPRSDALLGAAAEAALVVLGVPERWSREGLGPVRLRLAREARPPVLLVRRGPRPGGLAPPESLTRFTWSIGAATG